MVIIEDSRQQVGKHDHKNDYFQEQGITIVRSKLPYGDYAIMPSTTVDTKKDIYELAQDIDQDHERFKAECVGARDSGCKLIVLVENTSNITLLSELANWQEPSDHFEMRKRISKNPRTRRIEGSRLAKACITMSQRYGVEFLFCAPEDAGRIIVELLFMEGGKADE